MSIKTRITNTKDHYSNYLINSSFQEVDILFVWSFENDAQSISNKRYYLPNVEIEDYNVMIDGKTFLITQ